MTEGEEPSKLDLKIAKDKRRDELLEGIRPLWDDFHSEVQKTCGKLHDHFGKSSGLPKLNDHGNVIRVMRSEPVPNENANYEITLEVRLDADAQQLIANITRNHSRGVGGRDQRLDGPLTFSIVPNLDKGLLEIHRSKFSTPYSATSLAEYLIAERFWKIDLK